MQKINIKDLGLKELSEAFKKIGLEGYRATQVKKWIYQRQASSFFEMTNIKKETQELLDRHFEIGRLPIDEVQVSKDGTRKYRVRLPDGQSVESVFIPMPKRKTLCVSSQVGCAMDCRFCLTATMGLMRNLTVYEMVDQVGAVLRDLSGGQAKPPPTGKAGLEPPPQRPSGLKNRITNIVFMGMGEPLANTKNLYKALEILLDQNAYGFSRQHITVSTSGLAPQIEEFGHQTPVKLAISLNATTDDVRNKIMPINKRYPLVRLVQACRKMHLPKRNRITFEYVMLHGLNDTMEDAKRLVSLLSKLKAKINLIPFNPWPGSPYRSPPDEWVQSFQKFLLDKGFVANVRHSRGLDILGACGQLATRTQNPLPVRAKAGGAGGRAPARAEKVVGPVRPSSPTVLRTSARGGGRTEGWPPTTFEHDGIPTGDRTRHSDREGFEF